MLLDFKAIREGRSSQRFEVQPEDALLEGFFGRLTRPLDVPAEIVEQPHQTYLVTVRVRGEVEVPCRRCLAPARQTIDERTTLVYELTEPPGRGGRTLEAAEDEEVLLLRSPYEKVDIGPAIREALFLATEAFPLCTPECRGLCPECGEDLNVALCRCERREIGPRWGSLRELGS